ncbi:MAG: hypothetical protein QF780_03775 [Candidatus Marinimicrobia bacterium]|nr:hypothetical protein [Candidatus Neomarinimicrobiota bacterium]
MKTLKIKQRPILFILIIFTYGIASECTDHGTAPFSGTIFIDPDIITPDDPTTFESLYYNGTAPRVMYDRRAADWINEKPFLFPAKYNDGLQIEIQVNPEFGDFKTAQIQAEKYAIVIGRLTTQLRKDVETVWIHKGLKPFGGGNNNLLIHTDWSIKHYEGQGILEETFVHEASHTSLDSYHAKNADWLEAQSKDCIFISSYAEENPEREDIAESYLPYFAIRYRPERISQSLKEKIERAIPNRIRYFDEKNFNMHPLE